MFSSNIRVRQKCNFRLCPMDIVAFWNCSSAGGFTHTYTHSTVSRVLAQKINPVSSSSLNKTASTRGRRGLDSWQEGYSTQITALHYSGEQSTTTIRMCCMVRLWCGWTIAAEELPHWPRKDIWGCRRHWTAVYLSGPLHQQIWIQQSTFQMQWKRSWLICIEDRLQCLESNGRLYMVFNESVIKLHLTWSKDERISITRWIELFPYVDCLNSPVCTRVNTVFVLLSLLQTLLHEGIWSPTLMCKYFCTLRCVWFQTQDIISYWLPTRVFLVQTRHILDGKRKKTHTTESTEGSEDALCINTDCAPQRVTIKKRFVRFALNGQRELERTYARLKWRCAYFFPMSLSPWWCDTCSADRNTGVRVPLQVKPRRTSEDHLEQTGCTKSLMFIDIGKDERTAVPTCCIILLLPHWHLNIQSQRTESVTALSNH